MTIRSTTKFTGMMIALILLLAALPIQVQAASVDNLQFAVQTWTVQYLGGSTTYHKWELSWDTLLNQDSAFVQFKGGGVTDVWTTVSSSSAFGPQRSSELFDPLSNNPSGKTFQFRVKVSTCTRSGAVTTCTSTDWATLEHTF